MDIKKRILGAVLALGLIATAGSACRRHVDQAAPASASTAPAAAGVEASEGVVATQPAAEAPASPGSAAPTPARGARDARQTAAATAPATRRPPVSAAPPASSRPSATPPAPSRPTDPTRSVDSVHDERPVPSPVSEQVAAAAPPAAPAPMLEELVVSADSVIGLEVETTVSSEHARVEDEVVAQVTRDVRVGNRVAIPSGAKAHGEVTLVERGGRVKDRARLGVRFTSIVLADGTRVPIETDTIVREGSSPTTESTAKIGGGALGGAIIGGILGGAKGAMIGGSAGAGAGTAAVMAGGRNAATLSSGTPVTVRLLKPATVTVEK